MNKLGDYAFVGYAFLLIFILAGLSLPLVYGIMIIRNIRKGKHPLTGEPDSLARQNKENKERDR